MRLFKEYASSSKLRLCLLQVTKSRSADRRCCCCCCCCWWSELYRLVWPEWRRSCSRCFVEQPPKLIIIISITISCTDYIGDRSKIGSSNRTRRRRHSNNNKVANELAKEATRQRILPLILYLLKHKRTWKRVGEVELIKIRERHLVKALAHRGYLYKRRRASIILTITIALNQKTFANIWSNCCAFSSSNNNNSNKLFPKDATGCAAAIVH